MIYFALVYDVHILINNYLLIFVCVERGFVGFLDIVLFCFLKVSLDKNKMLETASDQKKLTIKIILEKRFYYLNVKRFECYLYICDNI